MITPFNINDTTQNIKFRVIVDHAQTFGFREVKSILHGIYRDENNTNHAYAFITGNHYLMGYNEDDYLD